MTAIFSVRKRAEEFAVALDGNADVTALHPELRELVTVAAGLREQPAPLPRPEFVATLREQLLTEAATVLTPSNVSLTLPVRTRGKRERRLVAAATAVVLVGGSAGMAAAAQDALPGQALYPIKRGIEQARVGLAVTPAGKGRNLLGQADDRLGEVRGLLASDDLGSAPQVPATLDAFADQATEGAELMMDSYQQTQDPATIADLRSFTVSAVATLESLAASAPEEAQSDLASAAMTLRDIDGRATELCSSCADDLPALEVPDLFLASAEASRALFELKPGVLDNSHPVPLGAGMAASDDADVKGSAKNAKPAASGAGSSSTDGSGEGTDGGSGSSTPSTPGGTLGLPQINEPATKGGGPIAPPDVKPPKSAGDDIEDGLGDLTKTLLPDLP